MKTSMRFDLVDLRLLFVVEAEKVAGLSPAELCARYAEVY
jgi:hypothetical protein